MAAHWSEERWRDDELDGLANPIVIAKRLKDEKKAKMREQTLKALLKQKYYLSQQQQLGETLPSSDSSSRSLNEIGISSDVVTTNLSDPSSSSYASNDSDTVRRRKKIKAFPAVSTTDSQSMSKITKRVVREHIHLDKSSMKYDPRPIDATCSCYTCRNFNRAYLHHLFRSKELIGPTLVTIHNIHFMNRLMRDIRHGELELPFSHSLSFISLLIH